MGELDGGTRELAGSSTLLFGADVIAEVHGGKDMTAFFYHELILNLPEPIRPAVEADRGRAVCEVVRALDSTTEKDFSALFQGDDGLPGFPSRMGYYIGYLVGLRCRAKPRSSPSGRHELRRGAAAD